MLTLLTLSSAAFAACPERPPKLALPWVRLVRHEGGDVIARGRRRGGQPHGTWCHWAPSGRLVEVVTWNRGLKDGPYHSWGHSESESEGLYVDGERHGLWIERGPSGTLTHHGAYEHGVPVGPWKSFDREGTFVGGEKHGPWKSDRFEESYEHGRLHGRRRVFDEDGRVVREESWNLGEREGPTRFLEDGIWLSGDMRGDERVGEWVARDAMGEIWRGATVKGERTGTWSERQTDGGVYTTTWVDGKKTGPFQLERNGQVVSEGAYLEDRPDGTWVSRNSREIRTLTYVDGVLDGPFRVESPDRVIREQGQHRAGRREGEWRGPQGTMTYVEGMKHGVWTHAADGVRTEQAWARDQRDGIERRWELDVLVRECGWREGRQHGLCTTWSAEGTPLSEWTWVDGVTEGPFTRWHPNGRRAETGSHLAGEAHGKWEAWHPNGKRAGQGTVDHGKHVGPWVAWHTTGVVERKGAYDAEGVEKGEWVERYPDGTLASQGPYVDGQRHGEWSFGYPSGQARLRGSYAHGRRDGLWTGWHPNGVMAKKGRYVDGKRNGHWTYWRPTGGIHAEVDFAEGAVVSRFENALFGFEPDPMPDPEHEPPSRRPGLPGLQPVYPPGYSPGGLKGGSLLGSRR